MEGTEVIKLKLTLAEAKELHWCAEQSANTHTVSHERIPMEHIELQNKLRFAIEDYEDGQNYGYGSNQEGSCGPVAFRTYRETSEQVPHWYGEDAQADEP